MNAINISGLRKSYGSIEVLKGINFQVEQGTLLALLGPNGAGKTTTVRILATLLQYSAGTVQIFGHDVKSSADKVRRRISLTGQFSSLDEELTGLENLILVARLLGFGWASAKARANELLASFGLAEAGERPVKHYSGGMRRRLDIAASIVVAPDLLFLDEPTTGLDVRSRHSIWDTIQALRKAGTTVLLTTQYLEEADMLADQIVIIDNGTIIANDTPAQLKASVGSGTFRLTLSNHDQWTKAEKIISQTLGPVTQTEPDSAVLHSVVADSSKLPDTFVALEQAAIPWTEFSFAQPTLDEVFLSLTGQ